MEERPGADRQAERQGEQLEVAPRGREEHRGGEHDGQQDTDQMAHILIPLGGSQMESLRRGLPLVIRSFLALAWFPPRTWFAPGGPPPGVAPKGASVSFGTCAFTPSSGESARSPSNSAGLLSQPGWSQRSPCQNSCLRSTALPRAITAPSCPPARP